MMMMLPNTVDGWLETTGALQDRIAALETDLRAALDIAEASAKECERLRAALEEALDLFAYEFCYSDGRLIEEYGLSAGGQWVKQARAALAPVGEEQTS